MGTNAARMAHDGEGTAMHVTEMLMESQRVSEKATRRTVTGQLRANERFAESFANGLMKIAASQTEAYLDMVQVLLDHSKEQQDVLHELAQSSTRTCVDFFLYPLSTMGPYFEEEPEGRTDQNGRGLPVKDYDRQNVEEVSQRLADLSVREIEELKTYEEHHENRTSLVERFERSLAECERSV